MDICIYLCDLDHIPESRPFGSSGYLGACLKGLLGASRERQGGWCGVAKALQGIIECRISAFSFCSLSGKLGLLNRSPIGHPGTRFLAAPRSSQLRGLPSTQSKESCLKQPDFDAGPLQTWRQAPCRHPGEWHSALPGPPCTSGP